MAERNCPVVDFLVGNVYDVIVLVLFDEGVVDVDQDTDYL